MFHMRGVEDLEKFRADTRRWLEATCPHSMRTPPDDDDDDVWGGRRAVFKTPDHELWLRRAAERGFTAPTWPRQFGGAGLDQDQAKILEEEMRGLGCRYPLKSFGLWMLGPVLLDYANDEQKSEHLPKIARGEIRW